MLEEEAPAPLSKHGSPQGKEYAPPSIALNVGWI